MSDAVKKQAQGPCEEISEKNGWVTFNINVGRQYPLKLSTKLETLVAAGRAAGQNVAVWTYAESEGGDNPNRPGQKYINRRLEKVEVGGALDPALAAASSSGSTGGSPAGGNLARSGDERVSIERQSIIKAGVFVLPKEEIKTLDDWFAFLDRVDTWIAKPRAEAAAPAAPAEPAPAAAATTADNPPDDDIPF